jgi:hypothetical protein
MGSAKGTWLALALAVALLIQTPGHAAPRPLTTAVVSVSSSTLVSVGDRVTLEGKDLDQVTQVQVDSKIAVFRILSNTQLELTIPAGVSPGDALVKITGSFGQLSYQNLFEVVPLAMAKDSKVTIGTFNGYLAVYTKNFSGRELRFEVGDRSRVIPRLQSNFTQNLTRIGTGTTVTVRVFIDQELIKVQRLRVR